MCTDVIHYRISIFIELFEQRLDVIIYRSHFVASITEARQLILHKNVKVNNKIVTKNSYILKFFPMSLLTAFVCLRRSNYILF